MNKSLLTDQGTIILYHGTAIESALDILNNGLNVEKLVEIQSKRVVQIGSGWYATESIDVAWFFASTALETMDQEGTVVEMELFLEHLESLFEQGLAAKSEILNVFFQGEQIWFHLDALDFLNQNAVFRPYRGI